MLYFRRRISELGLAAQPNPNSADAVWLPMIFASVLLEMNSMRSNRTVRLRCAKLIVLRLGLLGFCTGMGCAAVAQQEDQSSTADRPKSAYAVEGLALGDTVQRDNPSPPTDKEDESQTNIAELKLTVSLLKAELATSTAKIGRLESQISQSCPGPRSAD
jgi:hypothetical protein